MSKPTTFAPPSSTAASTRAISPVQVIVGVPLNGGVRYVSSSSATTTAGDEELSWMSPNIRHRSAVATSSDRPRKN